MIYPAFITVPMIKVNGNWCIPISYINNAKDLILIVNIKDEKEHKKTAIGDFFIFDIKKNRIKYGNSFYLMVSTTGKNNFKLVI